MATATPGAVSPVRSAVGREKDLVRARLFSTFRPKPNESPDATITRLELVRMTSQKEVGLMMTFVGYSWLSLHFLGVPKTAWPNILLPLGGTLPENEDGYLRLLHLLRQNEHYRHG